MRQTASIAAALAEALLSEAEDPKKFFKHIMPRPAGSGKPVAEYELEDIGIDHAQYFQGRGLYGHRRQWEAVYVGVGDNPAESISDALDQAAMDGWNVAGIEPDWPNHPSASAGFDPDEDNELYYYSAVYIKGRQSQAEALLNDITEAESPKKALKSLTIRRLPLKWPDESTLKWRNWTGPWGRKGRMARAMTKRSWGWGEEYDYHVPRTYFHQHDVKPDPDRPSETFYSVRYGPHHLISYDHHGNLRVDHWGSGAARERINRYLHGGWHITTWRGNAYWWNDEWPDNIRNRLHFDMRNRKDNKFPWWIPVRSSDYLTRSGDLVFRGGQGLARPDGSLKLGTREWPNLIKAPQGELSPVIRRGRRGFDPRQMQFQLESKYWREMDWIMRVRKKHAAMREASKRQKALDDSDKPERKKKRFNLH